MEGERAVEPIEGGIFNDDDEVPQAEEKDLKEEAEEDDPLRLQEDDTEESPKDETEGDEEKWKALIEHEENFTVKQITFVEILPDRRGAFPSWRGFPRSTPV